MVWSVVAIQGFLLVNLLTPIEGSLSFNQQFNNVEQRQQQQVGDAKEYFLNGDVNPNQVRFCFVERRGLKLEIIPRNYKDVPSTLILCHDNFVPDFS